jgi:hypothetical protein
MPVFDEARHLIASSQRLFQFEVSGGCDEFPLRIAVPALLEPIAALLSRLYGTVAAQREEETLVVAEG